jgi:hypothetical protein
MGTRTIVVCLRLAPAGRVKEGHGCRMKARLLAFGSIEVKGQRYEHDVVIDAGAVRKRVKKPSKRYAERFGHTPLSALEDIPWSGRRLIIGTGVSGRLPVMDEVVAEAARRGVILTTAPTRDVCLLLDDLPDDETYAILHVTC